MPGDVQLTPPAFTLPQERLLAAKVWAMTLVGLWEQCHQQSLVLCPPVSSPDWAGRPRSQRLQEELSLCILYLSCLQSHH